MNDAPYELDFFQRITDVHFDSTWFYVEWPGPGVGIAHYSVALDFPNQAGGTPGFIPIISTSPLKVPSFFRRIVPAFSRYTIRSSDVSKKIKTNAGANMTGFGLWPMTSQDGAMMFFKLDKSFPSSPFLVRNTFTGSVTGTEVNNTPVNVAIIKKNWMKAGQSFVNDQSDIPVESIAHGTSRPPFVMDFRINPGKLTVTGPV